MEPQNDLHIDEKVEEVEPTQKKPSINLPAAILTGAVIIALSIVIAFAPKSKEVEEPVNTAPEQVTSIPADVAKIRSSDFVRGNASAAEVVIFEYADSDCYWCGQFHPTLLSIAKEYPNVAIVYRHFPVVALHPNAMNEAIALECVGELGGSAQFNKYIDNIIDVTLAPSAKSNETLATFAKEQGLNEAAFKACVSNPNTAQKIEASVAEANSILCCSKCKNRQANNCPWCCFTRINEN